MAAKAVEGTQMRFVKWLPESVEFGALEEGVGDGDQTLRNRGGGAGGSCIVEVRARESTWSLATSFCSADLAPTHRGSILTIAPTAPASTKVTTSPPGRTDRFADFGPHSRFIAFQRCADFCQAMRSTVTGRTCGRSCECASVSSPRPAPTTPTPRSRRTASASRSSAYPATSTRRPGSPITPRSGSCRAPARHRAR